MKRRKVIKKINKEIDYLRDLQRATNVAKMHEGHSWTIEEKRETEDNLLIFDTAIKCYDKVLKYLTDGREEEYEDSDYDKRYDF